MNRIAWSFAAILFVTSLVSAQQVPDPNFRFANPSPAFESGKGPVVCIDEAHNNFHTAGGRYQSFADLLRHDGYVVNAFAKKFTAESLAECSVMTIANAIGDANTEDWAFPHPSTFTREELEAVYAWIRGGGALLLIVDHAPMPGAVRDLGTLLGAVMLDGYARTAAANRPPDIFSLKDGTLKPHAIVSGRNPQEAVEFVATFTGHAFQASSDFRPLMIFGPGSRAMAMLAVNFKDVPQSEWPLFSIEGWWHAGLRLLGKGRVVVLGEAAMCSAQLAGPEKRPMGMNEPAAAQNAQFCLNTIRWLTGVLEPAAPVVEKKP